MTNETLQSLVAAFNDRTFPCYYALRPLTQSVELGYIWTERPTGHSAFESSYKVYFVLSGEQCVGIVLDMGPSDLHWYVQERHRKQGYLHSALHECILCHLFGDGRKTQRVSVNSPSNAEYVVRQGFRPIGGDIYELEREQVDRSIVFEGRNSPLTPDHVDVLKARLREAQAIVMSVHESLRCHFGRDPLHLNDLAYDVGNQAFQLEDLDENGSMPSLG